LKFSNRWLTLVFFASMVQAAPTLVLDGGTLTGARGVDVGGSFFYVDFVETTCFAAYSGCDSTSDFVFQTLAGATAASQALLDQVLLNSVSGLFDTVPGLTFGCDTACDILTPYLVDSTGISMVGADNFVLEADDELRFASGLDALQNTAFFSNSVLAVWTPAAAVPEPSSLLLGAAGLAALGFARMRQARSRQ
jgi:hypothetical protein